VPPGYDVVARSGFFFRLDFRHPAVFFPTCHPFGFFAWGFFQLLFLGPWVFEAAVKEAVEPVKNISVVRSVIMIRNVLGIIVQFPWRVFGGSLPAVEAIR
jgi:hypothetical protein